jgi:hypothetical protein
MRVWVPGPALEFGEYGEMPAHQRFRFGQPVGRLVPCAQQNAVEPSWRAGIVINARSGC